MEARLARLAVLAAIGFSLGARYKTPNFTVDAPTPEFAEKVGDAAEKFRRELAIHWLGHALPKWSEPCPIKVKLDRGAGGVTSFQFERGEVYGWRMCIQGSPERILDSVLPHEVTHTIFASHFRQPLPRWADEGACTTVEHTSEKALAEKRLIEYLKTGRGIPFSRMFVMKEYPHDVLPLYAQGHSLAAFLIGQGGQRKFIGFLGDGLKQENWVAAVKQHYEYPHLGALQNAWLDWIKAGKPAHAELAQGALPPASPVSPAAEQVPEQVAQTERKPRPEPNLIYRAQSEDPPVRQPQSPQPRAESREPTAGWIPSAKASAAGAASALPPDPAPANTIAEQPPMRRPGKVLLEWSRNAAGANEALQTAASPLLDASFERRQPLRR